MELFTIFLKENYSFLQSLETWSISKMLLWERCVERENIENLQSMI